MSRLRFRATAKTEFTEGASSVRNAVRDPVASCPEPSPPLADIVQVSLGLQGKGTAWMDDVRIEPVGREVPLTEVDHRPSTLVNGDPEQSGAARGGRDGRAGDGVVRERMAPEHLNFER